MKTKINAHLDNLTGYLLADVEFADNSPSARRSSAQREAQIADLVRDGLNGSEIANLFGLTRSRIGQIVKHLGLAFKPRKVSVLCAHCKKPVEVFRSIARNRKNIFCSLNCSAKTRGPKSSVACFVCKKQFAISPSKLKRQARFFCSAKCYHSLRQDGRYRPNRQGQRNARATVSKYFALEPQHVVHHEDRDNLNNSLPNLRVFASQADHMAYHHGADVAPLWDGRAHV